ncbi:MAG: hypothetical protein ABIR66_02650 [Saprospiraceae bacterium]
MNTRCIKVGLVILSLIFTLRSQAQFDAMNGKSISDFISIKNSEAFAKSSDIEGSPYATDSFKLGKVYTTKGVFNGVYLRYDLFNDWIEFLEKGKHLILSPEPSIVKVEIDSITLYAQPFYKEGKLTMGFFKMLYDKNIILLKHQSVKFNEKPPTKAVELISVPASFSAEADKFFIRFNHMEAKPILAIKKLVSMFPDHEKEIASFVKRKNIRLNQNDLMSLVTYYSKVTE